jgi:hypothetical protein
MRARSVATALLVAAVGLAGCKTEKASESIDASPTATVPVADTATALFDAAPPRTDGGKRRSGLDPNGYAAKVQAWNEALNHKDVTALGAMYAPGEIAFYGAYWLSRAQVLKAKSGYFAAHPDFAQTVDDIDVQGSRVTFAKTSTVDGKATTYAAYLFFTKGLISVESDETTDKVRQSSKRPFDGERCQDAAGAVVAKVIQDNMDRCQKTVDQGHDPAVHCAGMDQPNGGLAFTFEVFIDHDEHVEPVVFVNVDVGRRTATEEGVATEGEERPVAFDLKAMDDAVKICAEHPPK